MQTQENVKPLILDKEVGNRLNEIKILEKKIAGNREVLAQIQTALADSKKIDFGNIDHYRREAETVKLSFFQTVNNEKYVIEVIDSLIARRIVAMQMSGKSEVSDGPRSYEHHQTLDADVSDITIINQFHVAELSSLDEILVTAYHLIMDDLHDFGILAEIGNYYQENLNIGYCELSDESGTHIYVVYLKRMGKKPDGRMHYNLHYTKIPSTYKANQNFLLKKS